MSENREAEKEREIKERKEGEEKKKNTRLSNRLRVNYETHSGHYCMVSMVQRVTRSLV